MQRFTRARVLGFAFVVVLVICIVLIIARFSMQTVPQIVLNLSTAHGYNPQQGPLDPAIHFPAGSTIYAVFREQLDSLPLASRGCLKGVLQGDNVFATAGPTAIPPYPQAVTGGWAYLPFQPGPPAASLMATITVFWSSAASCIDPQAVWHTQAQISVAIE